MITGCHPGECHYLEQNYKAMRRYHLLQRTLAQLGVEPQRVKLVWASAAEGVRLAQEITKLVEEIRALGPLNWPTSTGGAAEQMFASPEHLEVQEVLA
jgi:F420-non-reducing hydrogenase iron-sulfur subunit